MEKIRRDHNLGETKSAEEFRQQKKPLSRKSKVSSDGRTKKQYDCTRCGRKHGPKQRSAYGRECSKCNRKGLFAEQWRSKGNADSSTKRSTTQKQISRPKKKFQEATADSEGSEVDFSEYDTDGVTVQANSVEAKAEETKSTKTHFGKKLPKHVIKVYENQSPDTTVEHELLNGSAKKPKGKVDTGAQVNLMNYTAMMQREFCTTVKWNSQAMEESASGTMGNSILTVFKTMMSLATCQILCIRRWQ